MSIPYAQKFFPINTPEERMTRSIDNHYHLAMVAENSYQIVEYQAQAMRMQHETAIMNLKGMAEIASRQDEANEHLSTFVGEMERLRGGMDGLHAGVRDLNRTTASTLAAANAQSEALRQGFESVASGMLAQQMTLTQIADALRRPCEANMLELLGEAEVALKAGMRSTGRDQTHEFADSLRLLSAVLENPIGGRNYVAWFQIGWLRWKFLSDYAGAEEAFYHAARLSRARGDLYHLASLRHMAYMQYFLGRHSDACETSQQALDLYPDEYDLRYDTARYAARAGQAQQALDLMEECIRQQPQGAISMFADEDFRSLQERLVDIMFQKTELAREIARAALGEWRAAAARIVEHDDRSGEGAPLQAWLDELSAFELEAERALYAEAILIADRATARRREMIEAAEPALVARLAALDGEIGSADEALAVARAEHRERVRTRLDRVSRKAEALLAREAEAALQEYNDAIEQAPRAAGLLVQPNAVEKIALALGRPTSDRLRGERKDLVVQFKSDARERYDMRRQELKAECDRKLEEARKTAERQEQELTGFPEIEARLDACSGEAAALRESLSAAEECLVWLRFELGKPERALIARSGPVPSPEASLS